MCGEGLGHTSRCIGLARELVDAGHDIELGAYGYSKELCEKSGFAVREIPSELSLVGKSGFLDMKGSVEATMNNANILGGPQMMKLLAEVKPDIVVSDSYYIGALAAKAMRIPVHMIVNQTNMLEFFRNRGTGMRLLGEVTKSFYFTVFEHVDSVIIPDFPPPYTVCAKNIVFTQDMAEKLFYSGPLIRKRWSQTDAADIKMPHVLSMIGGVGYRENMFRTVLSAANAAKDIGFTLVSGPSVDLSGYEVPDNVDVLPFIEDPFPYLKGSDVLIAPGGHSGMMEAMSFGVPVISCPDMLHSEQENNAQRLEEMGLGLRISYQTPPQVLSAAIDELSHDGRGRPKRMRELAEALNGTKRLRKMLEKSL